jgi:hypothetical protein
MKFRITIEIIGEKPVIKEVYVDEDDRTKDHPETYKNVQTMQSVDESIYEQTIEEPAAGFDLKKVINAFNQ